MTSCHITFRHIPSYHINTPFECLPNTLLLTPSSLHPTNTLHPTITPYYLTNTLLCTSTYPPSLHIYAAVHEHSSPLVRVGAFAGAYFHCGQAHTGTSTRQSLDLSIYLSIYTNTMYTNTTLTQSFYNYLHERTNNSGHQGLLLHPTGR